MNYFNIEVLKKIHTDNPVIIDGYSGDLLVVKKYGGDIYLPTGEIAAFDPERRYANFLSKKDPFVDKVKPGTYKVNIFYAFNKQTAEIAFSEIVFSDEIPEKFIMALNTVDKYAKVKPGMEFGFTILSGYATYADVETLTVFNDMLMKKTDELESFPKYRKEFWIDCESSKIRKTTEDGFGCIDIDDKGHNVFTFEVQNCNFCPSFWGIDRKGNKCCLITDFLIHS